MSAALALHVAGGLALGLAVGALHLVLLRRAVRRLVDERRAAAIWLGAPLRVALPALAVFALARASAAAALAGAAGLVIAELAGRSWLRGQESEDRR